jgi:hypothetical protein
MCQPPLKLVCDAEKKVVANLLRILLIKSYLTDYSEPAPERDKDREELHISMQAQVWISAKNNAGN